MSDAFEPWDITRAFVAHDIDTSAFGHAEHVRVAFDLLNMHDFIDASALYANGDGSFPRVH